MSALKPGGFAALLLLLASAEVVLAAPPSTEVHRKSVHALEAAGWQPAVSTGGHFSVRVPAAFDDFTVHAEVDAIGETVVHVIGGRSGDGVTFTVTETPFVPRMNRPDIGELATDFGKKPGTKVSDITRDTRNGVEQVSFSVSGPASSAYMRVIKTATALYNLTLEFPNAKRARAVRIKGAFLDSFRLKD